MTYLDAVRAMVRVHGAETIYSDGAEDWDGDALIEAAADAMAESEEPDERDYAYSQGVTGHRPGVYIGADGYISSVPVVEPSKS